MISLIIKILNSYKFNIILIFYYEFKYFLLNYHGWYFKKSINKNSTDTIPAPFFFLHKTSIFFKKKNIKSIVDLGCGTGRTLFFFNKKFKNIKVYGIENDKLNYSLAKKEENKKIKVFFGDILKFKFKKKFSVFFLNDPIKQKSKYNSLIKKILRTGSYLVTVNINFKIDCLKKSKLEYCLQFGEKNLKIYRLR